MWRGRESVRNYRVQLAELFQLVGLPNTVCGTRERARESVTAEKMERREKRSERREESDKANGREKKLGVKERMIKERRRKMEGKMKTGGSGGGKG